MIGFQGNYMDPSHAINSSQLLTNGAILPSPAQQLALTTASSSSTGFTSVVPAPPVYAHGELYWGDGSGRLRGIDFRSEDSLEPTIFPWVVDTTTAQASCVSPTVGWVRDPSRSVMDQVVYLSDNRDAGNTFSGNIRPFVMSAKGDILDQSFTRFGQQVSFFAHGKRENITNIRVYFKSSNGGTTAVDPTTVSQTTKGTIFISNIPANSNLTGQTLAANYDIDPTPSPIGSASTIMNRTSIQARVALGTWMNIDAAPVLGPSDIFTLRLRTILSTLRR